MGKKRGCTMVLPCVRQVRRPSVPLSPGSSERNPMKHFAIPLLAVFLSVPAFAADNTGKVPDPMAPGLSGPQKLQALVDRVRYEQKQLKTLEARFVQQQESSMLAQ